MLKRYNRLGPKLSVVVITHNRKEILKKCLMALFNQTYPEEDYEIVIIDDGSTDDTSSMVTEIMESSPVVIRYFKQENRGVAVARNNGILQAKGEISLLIGDDIIATPTLIEEHMKWHAKYGKENHGVLGYITWSPEIKVTDFMWWLENGGFLLNYPSILNRTEVNFRFFYTGNISLKSSYLKKNLFCEDFFFGYADTELGYRISKKGFRLFFNKNAVAYHCHPMDFSDFEKRMEKWGISVGILLQKHPELRRLFKIRNIKVLRLFKLICTLLSPLARIVGYKKMIYHLRYGNRLLRAYYRGYQSSTSYSK